MAQSPVELAIFDCATGDHLLVDKTPFTIGSGGECDWCVPSVTVALQHGLFQQSKGVLHLLPGPEVDELLVDGMLCSGAEITPGEDHTLIVGRQLLAFRSGDARAWLAKMDHTEWFIFDKETQAQTGPYAFAALAPHLQARADGGAAAVLLCGGLTTMGFYADQVLPWLPNFGQLPAGETSTPEPMSIDVEYGEFTCPVCWLKFDRGDTMNIAVHASLRGDPILGEHAMQRFHATRFTDRGQAVDAMNIPAPEQSCPHCRRKLPSGFLDAPHYIFSIVGAPSSGKSYYLSVLVKVLQTTLFQEFGLTFRDADPSENVILNQMKNQLFSGCSPEEAMLEKTQLEGSMYETLPRLGRSVRLPKPFIFNLSAADREAHDLSLVFYDNAGEHFEPTRNSADSPGAQHIAAASGIFFLFDPLHNVEFRRRLAGLDDPQMESRRLDQQDIILAESEVRIKTLLGLESRDRIKTPLAVIVGKSDTWLHLLGHEIEPAFQSGHLELAAVQRNSAHVRMLLLGICPEIVANAEAISSDVMYFAASPLGSSPVAFVDARGERMIGPDPQRLHPQHVEIPTLWVLSRVAPEMIPIR